MFPHRDSFRVETGDILDLTVRYRYGLGWILPAYIVIRRWSVSGQTMIQGSRGDDHFL